ncbi:ferritin-like domain-containing protein [Halalkalibacterium ligniniphilum]|uniref:ferritin-like domain-containing protein n=1 Tax=Halalkalibacterium ligniniphilum TaxID=1134413 RepID=UPI00068473CA|nr:ferritin-like domain-containing protein [Halalkalibacterium ligniniphilum]
MPPWLLYYLTQERATPTLIDKVHQAVNGEYNAISCYEKMIQLAPTKMEKEIITEIRQDEYKHYQTFSTIYTNLTGQQPKPQLDEPCPPTYEEALKFAIEDEQHTVDFYMEVGDQAQNPHIKEVFYRAAKDEQNHAVWFLYFYTRRVG